MNLPTKLTFLRILLIPIFVAVFFIPFPGYRFVAVGIFAVASLTDFLDGYLARKWNQVTTLGKFLDPIADKLLVACALIVVSIEPINTSSPATVFQILVAIFSMIIICRELLVSCFRIVAASKSITLAADKLGKIKTVFQMFALIFLIPVKSILDSGWGNGLEVFNENSSINSILTGLHGEYLYLVGFCLLAIATIFTIISGANYIIKNKGVLKDEQK